MEGQREGGRERGEGGGGGRGKERHRYTHTERVLLFYVYLIGYSCHSQS